MIQKAKWYIKQLFPCWYISKYRNEEGQKRISIFKMWLGRYYSYEDYPIGNQNGG